MVESPPLKETLRARAQDAYQRAILEAAEVVFTEHGMAGATMARVARQAGVSVGTVYNHFENKDHLFRSLLALRGREFLLALEELELESRSPLDQLRALITATFAYLDAHRATYAVFIELGATSQNSIRQIGGPEAEELHDLFFERYVAIVAMAQGAGQLTGAIEPSDLVALLTGGMSGVIVRRMRASDDRPLVDCADFIVDHFIRGAQP